MSRRASIALVLGTFLHEHQIAQFGKRIRQPRHSGLRQTAASRQILIAEHAIAMAEAGEQFQSARQCVYEMSIRRGLDH
jgi:hypothetical protein